MVVFFDLDEDVSNDPHAHLIEPAGFALPRCLPFNDHEAPVTSHEHNTAGPERPNPNLGIVSAALGSYPYVHPILCLVARN